MPLDATNETSEPDEVEEELDPRSPESIAAFFKELGVSIDDKEDAGKTEDTEEGTPEPDADKETEEEKPADKPAETPAATPAPAPATEWADGELRRDEGGRVVDKYGNLFNEVGLPLITEDEWQEHLADPTQPPGQALKEYTDYQLEYRARTAAQQQQLVSIREQEKANLPNLLGEWFEDAAAAEADFRADIDKVFEHVPAQDKLKPGYYEQAARLLFASDPVKYLKKYGVSSKIGKEVDKVEVPNENEFSRAEEPKADAKGNLRLARPSGSRAGAELATPPPAKSTTASDYGLTKEEKDICKKLGMTLKEYAENK